MDSVRYYLALLLLITTPGVFLFCFSVHLFVRLWRRLGLGLTYGIHFSLMAIVAVGLFLLRKPLLSVQFGTNPVLIMLTLPIFLLAVVVARQRRKQLGVKVLVCLPELAPQKYESKLATDGIYSRIRHPRYMELLLFMMGHALIANYLVVYVVFLLSLAGIGLVVRLEESELRVRFGKEYERYCERVPRFFLRF